MAEPSLQQPLGQDLDDVYCGVAPTPETLNQSWNFDPYALLVIAAISLLLARQGARPLVGIAVTVILGALFISPLCALTSALFSARTVHHVVLVAIVAPMVGKVFARSAPGGTGLTAAVILHAATFWIWHHPAFYDAALRSAGIYWLMQASLLGTAVLVWQRVFANNNLANAIAALFATATQMGMLGALLTFAGRPQYALHLMTTEPFGLSALEDQQLAGLIMWVPGALPYLGAAAWLAWSRLGAQSALKRA